MSETAAVVLVTLAAAAGGALRWRGRTTAGRRCALAALAAALVLLAFAPFSSHAFGDVGIARVVAIDVSGSMADVERVLAAEPWGAGRGRLVVLSFGARAHLLHDGEGPPPPLRFPAAALTAKNRRIARLEEALGAAATALGGAPFELVVVSDGGFDAAAAALAVGGDTALAAVRVVAPPPSRTENVGIRFVTPPLTVAGGAAADVELEVAGRVLVARPVTVAVTGAADREVVITPDTGSARLRVVVPGVTGTITARLDVADWDAERRDDRATLPVHVRRETPRVAVATTAPAEDSSDLVAALGASLDPRPDLDEIDVLVLHECEGTHTLVDDPALRRFVGSGGGLLLAGSHASFGLGGWEDTVADALSPLRSRPSQRRIVTVALDRSGSMERDGRFTAASRAVVALAARLGGDDRLRLIPFGADAPEHELAAADAAGGVRRILEGIRPSGGTDLGRALDAALDHDVPRGAASVVVVLTDARDRRAMVADRLDAWRRTADERGHALHVLWFDRDEALRPLLLRLVGGDPTRLVAVDDFSRLTRPLLAAARRGLVIEGARVEVSDGRAVAVDRLVTTCCREEADVLAAHAPGIAALATAARGAGRAAAAPITLDSRGIAALFGGAGAFRDFVYGLASGGDDTPEAVAVEECRRGWRYRVTGRTSPGRLATAAASHELRRVGAADWVTGPLTDPPPAGVVTITDPDGRAPIRRPVAAPDLRDRAAGIADVAALSARARPPEPARPLLLALAAFAILAADIGLRLLGR